MTDFLPGQLDVPDSGMGQQTPTQNPLEGLGGLGQQMNAANSDPAKQPIKWKADDEGNIEAKLTAAHARELLQKVQFANEAMVSLHNKEAMDLLDRENKIRANPVMNVLTQLAAQMGQAKDMPGWVQAAGRASQALNPTADTLRQQRMGIQEQMGQGLQQQGRMAMEQYNMATTAEEHKLRREELIANQNYTRGRQAKEDLEKDVNKAISPFEASAKASGIQPPPLDEFSKFMKQRVKGITDDAVKLERDRIAAIATGKSAEMADVRQQRKDDQESQTRLTRGLINAARSSDKSEAKAARTELAKSLAAGDLFSIRELASLRGDERMLLVAEAKRINPNFNTAELNRKIDMEKSFTVGKDGIALQSFDTWLQHAGEVTETLKKVEMSNTPAFNKPMNWWRKNMEGSPEYQQLLVSLEPAGKEFESFLLNNRALYAEDRKTINTIIDGNSSPKQILAALNQMGKTAKDRLAAMNQRYKTTMGHDLDHPVSPEAAAGAAKIGLKMPTPKASDTKKYPWEK